MNETNSLEKISFEDIPQLDVFKNQHHYRDYEVTLENPSLISECPMTGEKDYAHITITYVPHELCLEFRSLRRYMRYFYNKHISHESIANRIMDDIIQACNPRRIHIHLEWTTVDGTQTKIYLKWNYTMGENERGRKVTQSPGKPIQIDMNHVESNLNICEDIAKQIAIKQAEQRQKDMVP